MPFCPNCGTQTGGAFCPNCGTAVGGANPGAGTTGGYVPPGSPSSVQAPGLTENVASALCYLFGLITGIIFLVLAPYNQNKTVRFHAFQAIFAHVALIVLWILFVMVTHGFGFALLPLFWLLVLLLWLYMMYSAYNNRKVKLPLVGDLAEKQA
ncbi:MAG: hypothetical protein JO210_14300 [Acidobacteriaceae bacterium]|nr:hypothetical protein [Acidobacteriaceae bacterium]